MQIDQQCNYRTSKNWPMSNLMSSLLFTLFSKSFKIICKGFIAIKTIFFWITIAYRIASSNKTKCFHFRLQFIRSFVHHSKRNCFIDVMENFTTNLRWIHKQNCQPSSLASWRWPMFKDRWCRCCDYSHHL